MNAATNSIRSIILIGALLAGAVPAWAQMSNAAAVEKKGASVKAGSFQLPGKPDWVTVHYWPSRWLEGTAGHVAITLSDGTYISWWPDHKFLHVPADKARTLAKDSQGESLPPRNFTIRVRDEKQIRAWWEDFKRGHDFWDYHEPNCVTVVQDALSAGSVSVATRVHFPDQLVPALQALSAGR